LEAIKILLLSSSSSLTSSSFSSSSSSSSSSSLQRALIEMYIELGARRRGIFLALISPAARGTATTPTMMTTIIFLWPPKASEYHARAAAATTAKDHRHRHCRRHCHCHCLPHLSLKCAKRRG